MPHLTRAQHNQAMQDFLILITLHVVHNDAAQLYGRAGPVQHKEQEEVMLAAPAHKDYAVKRLYHQACARIINRCSSLLLITAQARRARPPPKCTGASK